MKQSNNAVLKLKGKYARLPVQVKASFWFLICSFTQKAISMITMPIFTRVMSSMEYGQYSIYNSWLGIVTVFASFNLSLGVYAQGLVKYEADRRQFISSMQGLSTVLIGSSFLIYLLFHDFFNNWFGLNSRLMYLMFLSIWGTTVFDYWAIAQKVDYKYKLLVLITLCVAVSNPLLSLFFMHIQADQVFGRVLGMTAVSLIAYGWMYFYQMHRGKVFFSRKYWSKALLLGIPLIPHYLSQRILHSADKIMIGRYVSQSAAGIYSVAFTASSIMIMFNSAMMQTISPWVYRKIRDEKIKDIAPIAYVTMAGVAILNLMLIAVAPEFLKLLAPPEYVQAVWVIPPVAMSVLFMFAYDLFAKFEFFYEKTNLISLTTMVGAAANVVLNYIFINLFGFVAAAYTSLFCYILYAVAHYLSMRKICKDNCNGVQPYRTGILIAFSVIFIATGFILLLLYEHVILRYLLVTAVVVAVFIKRKKLISIFSMIKQA